MFNIASASEDVKTTTLANAWKNLLYAAEDVEQWSPNFSSRGLYVDTCVPPRAKAKAVL